MNPTLEYKGGGVDLRERGLEKRQFLRNLEYYNMQDVVDNLYTKSKEGHSFNNLMDIISTENNIMLAYRNIRNNKGSNTKGTDGLTIRDIKTHKYLAYKIITDMQPMYTLILVKLIIS